MIKYLVTLGALVAVVVAVVYAQTEGEKTDLEESSFLFRPVYIRYGYHPHNSYGWKGAGGQAASSGHHTPGWGWGYGWGSYHLHGGKGSKKAQKKKAKAKKKAHKKAQKAKKKAQKKGGGGQGWGWGGAPQTGGWGGGGYGGYGGGYGGYGGFDE